MTEAQQPAWRRSSRCAAGNCLEAAPAADQVLLRNSTDETGPVLAFSRAAWADFIEAVKHPGLWR